jgi:peptidoglycan/LPS O-acetylase OafA/YrhL
VDTAEHEPGAAIARIPALDGLRGIAILLVVAHHFGMSAGFARDRGNPIGVALERLLSVGWVGVDLFFVLSGFLITSILLASRNGPRYFSSFYGRRILRIFPLYFGALLLGLVLLPAIAPRAVGVLGESREHAAWLVTYTSNVALALGVVASFGVFDMFWTLAIEEQFYLTWPLLVKRLSRRRLAVLAISTAVGALALRCAWMGSGGNWMAPFRFTLTRVDDLALGALVALILANAPAREIGRRWAPAAFTVSLLGFAVLFSVVPAFYPDATLVVTLGLTVLGMLFAASVLVAACEANRGIRLLERPGLRSWGRLSYGIYVWHWPLLLALRNPYRRSGIAPTASGQLLQSAGFLLVGFAGSYAVGWLSYHLFEVHFLRLKRHFEYHRTK